MTKMKWVGVFAALMLVAGTLSAQTNLALIATATNSGGGTAPSYGPDKMNDGNLNTRQWVSTSAANHWAQLTWANPETVWEIHIYQSGPTNNRWMKGCTVEYWDGANWIVDSTWDDSYTTMHVHYLFAPRTTTQIRLTNMICVGTQSSNPWIREWEVYAPQGPVFAVNALSSTQQSVPSNATDVTAGVFSMTAHSSTAMSVSEIEVTASGTGDDVAAYSSVAVYRDANSNNTYDSGTDVLVGSASAFPSDNGALTLSVAAGEQNFAANETRTYLIVVSLANTAVTADTLEYQVTSLTVGSGQYFGTSQLMPGLVIEGPSASPAITAGFPEGVLNNETGGGNGFEAATFDLVADSFGAVDVLSLTIEGAGSGDHTSAYSEFAIYRDETASGTVGSYDTGDAPIGTGTFTGSPATTTITFPTSEQSFAASETKTYFIVIKFNGTAPAAATFDYVISAGTASGLSAVLGTPSDTMLGISIAITSFPYSQGFDGFTGVYSGYRPTDPHPLVEAWYNDLSDGGPDWMAYRGSTPNTGTGPTVDHTYGTTATNALYLYIEDSNFNSGSGDINLISPAFDISSLTAPVFEFWLHNQVGNGGAITYANTLHVDLIDAATGNVTQDFITAIQGDMGAAWNQVSVDLSSITTNIVHVQLRWEGTGSSWYNDIAVDDFVVRDAPDIHIQNQGTSANIANGGTDAIGGVLTTGQTFTWDIQNLGGANLTLTGSPTVQVTPISNVNANVTAFPTSPIAASGTSSFDINIAPAGAGGFSFDVTIASDDPDEDPYVFTVSGNGVANQPPAVTIPTGSNWVNNAGNYELFVDPGNAYNDDLEVDDPTPDNMTVTVTPPGTAPTTITSQPASIGTPTAGPITLSWAGTADATNPPGGYVWQFAVDDGVNTVNFTATIFINDLAPVHAAGIDANTGDGQASATAYTGTALVGSSNALTLADLTNPNTGQAMTLGNITPDGGNPAGGSGFTITFVADSIVATPTAALVLADVGTHIFDVEIDDAGNTTNAFVAIDVQTPEIDVERNSTAIADGGADTVTGAMAGQNLVLTYDITNNGTSDLTITTALTSNLVNCTANVTLSPAGTVTPTSSTTLEITVNAGVGAFSFDIAINNDDVDEDPYDIAVSGNAAAAPEIDVDRAGTPVADGATDALGTLNTGVANNVVYTITNNGTSDLTVTGVTVSGFINCTATVTVQPAGTVTPTSTTTFTVQINPTADGPFSVGISIASDDADENPYDITATGTAQTSVSGGGGGGGGGGGCAGGSGNLPLFALLLLAATVGLAWRRRRA